jgi:hypothetical protein
MARLLGQRFEFGGHQLADFEDVGVRLQFRADPSQLAGSFGR